MFSSPLVGPFNNSVIGMNRYGDFVARTPGSKDDQELNTQVISRRWYPSPKPSVDSTISVVNGLHRANGMEEFQSGAITITSATKYIETLVMSDVDEYETKTEAIQLFSDGAIEFIFEAWTKVDPATVNTSFPYVFPFILE